MATGSSALGKGQAPITDVLAGVDVVALIRGKTRHHRGASVLLPMLD
jgi:hypothetical protein